MTEIPDTEDSGQIANPEAADAYEAYDAYIPRDRRHALSSAQEIPDRLQGSAIFADISGFTKLTEALRDELGPELGAEVLTANLDRVFHAIITQLHRYGGNVIYFSGDAITAWIDGDDGRRAIASGLAMQSAMAKVGRMVTGTGTLIRLALKVAIATGEVRRTVVGDPDIQRIDVLAGSLLDDLAETERHAEQGEILIDESTLRSVGDEVALSHTLVDPQNGCTYGVVERLVAKVPEIADSEPPPLDLDVIQQWLLPVVYERISAGRGEFLAELRPAYPMFVHFTGLDFDRDDRAIEQLKDFVIRAQRIFDSYGGSVLQLTLGDKGAYLYGVFGSPVAHEEDAARAASAALKLIRLEEITAVRDVRIGIAHGLLRSGAYGHAMRRTFSCLGDAANTAARLMDAAQPETIFATDDVCATTNDAFVWAVHEPLKLKGKDRPVSVSKLVSTVANTTRRKLRYELPIFGRQSQLRILYRALDSAIESRSQVTAVSAEAGIGKSRLIAEFVLEARRREILVAFGECQSFGINTSYFVWRDIWRKLLQIDNESDPDQQRAAAEEALAHVDPTLVARAPLLSNVIGVSIPDTELTGSFDAKLRKSSTEDLLATYLLHRATVEPMVIVLEDCHWIDGLSRDLLDALVRSTGSHRVLFLLAYRPAINPGGDLRLGHLQHYHEILLEELDDESIRLVIGAKAQQVYEVDQPPETLSDIIVARSQGNPFYAEELLNYIASQGVLPIDVKTIQNMDLPDSLHNLVLSRIDSLAENPRRTLKVASVIGRQFQAPMLWGAYPALGELEAVKNRLEELRSLDLITLDHAETLSYLFRHVLTQEVSYNSMPFAIRTGLHRRIGQYIESTEAEDLEPHLDLLAHHYWHSDDEAKKREYLIRAEQSASRRYANGTAIDYGERLISLVKGPERAEALLRLGKVLELTGAWLRAEEVAQEALTIARSETGLAARCEAALAEIARKQGHYDTAMDKLRIAATTFRALGDDEGLGTVLHVSGSIAAQRGHLQEARNAYEESLEIRVKLNDQAALASLHSNLAIVAQYSGDYSGARHSNERALAIRREIGDRWGIGVSLNNIGMVASIEKNHSEARVRFEEAIRLCQEVGDPWMVALARDNLGNAFRELGDYEAARENYTASLETYRNNDDLWALAYLFEDIAILAADMNAASIAFELLGSADSFRESIKSPRSASQEGDISDRLRPARESLGKADMETSLQRGRFRSASKSIEAALSFTRMV